MKHWKLTTNRKKIQRHFNKIIRDLNKSIERDELWLGRFYAHQKFAGFYTENDYTYAKVEIEFVDRKTGITHTQWFHKEDFMGSTWKIWCAMNDFIVKVVDVWHEDPRPSIKEPWDYRKVGKK